MIIALPTVDKQVCMHFGHCQQFALVEVDDNERKILNTKYVDAPPHQPGLLPPWLKEQGANFIIAGGMGQRAVSIFNANDIEVLIGAPSDTPENLVRAYLDGNLQTGQNVCDH